MTNISIIINFDDCLKTNTVHFFFFFKVTNSLPSADHRCPASGCRLCRVPLTMCTRSVPVRFGLRGPWSGGSMQWYVQHSPCTFSKNGQTGAEQSTDVHMMGKPRLQTHVWQKSSLGKYCEPSATVSPSQLMHSSRAPERHANTITRSAPVWPPHGPAYRPTCGVSHDGEISSNLQVISSYFTASMYPVEVKL